jgi:hypothetical protein
MSIRDGNVLRRFLTLARNSPWLLIALGLHLIVGLVLSVVYLSHESEKVERSATTLVVAAPRVELPPEPAPPEEERSRQSIPENDIRRELVSIEENMSFVPLEEDVPEDLTLELGDPTGTEGEDASFMSSTSIGVGTGGIRGHGPSPFPSRNIRNTGSGGGKGRVPGPTAETEEAVVEGLRWLLRHQNEDGSWGAATIATHCTGSPCIPPDAALGDEYDVGMTSLALLAFLGQGISIHTKVDIVDSVQGKRHEAGDAVLRGVRWLLDRQGESGSFSAGTPFAFPENETLATMVLCEAYGMSRSHSLRRPAQLALDFLAAAQKLGPDGERSGWGYGSRADIEQRHARGELDDEERTKELEQVDLSITCWVTMALCSARISGLEVPDEVLAGALRVARTTADVPSSTASTSASAQGFDAHSARWAALGMLIRSFVDHDLSDPFLEPAAMQLALDPPRLSRDGASVDFYYWYFGSIALNQFDGPDSPRPGHGKYWEPWNEGLKESLLPLQDTSRVRGACSRGGWLGEANGNERGRALYNTALNILTLEVYYRFVNVFGAVRNGPAAKRPK